LATNFRGKVVGVSIKDRGAIFPAGHQPNGAYWYDKSAGKLITSTYYREALPRWVDTFNAKELADDLLNQTWETLYPIDTYLASEEDEQTYEFRFRARESSGFPYDLKKYRNINGNYGMLPSTPFGNSWVLEAGIAAIEGEGLGADATTDFLALSFSSTDYIGHGFGPRAIETEDTYLRLDQDLARLLNYLDNEVGKGEYVVFLTADHGASDIPEFSQKHGFPGGEIPFKMLQRELDTALAETFGSGKWVLYLDNEQVYLNHDLIKERGVDYDKISGVVVDFFLNVPGIANVFTAEEMRSFHKVDITEKALDQGFNVKRSGDILLVADPGYMNKRKSGTTHGTGYAYDTHVPFLLYGKSVPQGTSVKRYSITDISPTLSMLLNIGLPSAATGDVIEEVFPQRVPQGN
jgi:hypothetical protein